MDPSQPALLKPPNSDWRFNHVVLETIFENLDLSDLKSASLVCQEWSTSTSKAFGAKSRTVLQDPGPDGESTLRSALQRFRLQKEMALTLDSDSNGLCSTFSEFPVGNLMTHLSISYEPTFELVADINGLLRNLVGGFPSLKQLELRPKVNSEDSQNVPDDIEPSDGSEGVHRSLQVLVVSIGHLASSGLDWGFLKSLVNLKTLHLLDFESTKDKIPQRQLATMASNLSGRRLKELVVDFNLCHAFNRYKEREDTAPLTSLVEATQPAKCKLLISENHPEADGFWSMSSVLRCIALAGVNADIEVETGLKRPPSIIGDCKTRGFALFLANHRHNTCGNIHLRLLFKLDFDDLTSFIEFRVEHFHAPIYVRYGPSTDDYSQVFQQITKGCLEAGFASDIFDRCDYYNVLQKFTFGQDLETIETRRQYRAAGSTLPDYMRLFHGPSNWIWEETSFADDSNPYLTESVRFSRNDPLLSSFPVAALLQCYMEVYIHDE